MDKLRLYDEIRSRIYDLLSNESFNCEYGHYDDEAWFEIDDFYGLYVEVMMKIGGYNKHHDGDYYNPSYDEGEIWADVVELDVWDGDEKILCEKNVSELHTKIEY